MNKRNNKSEQQRNARKKRDKKRRLREKEPIIIKNPVKTDKTKFLVVFLFLLIISLSVLIPTKENSKLDCLPAKGFSTLTPYKNYSNQYIGKIKKEEIKSDLYEKIYSIVKNTPMEAMIEEISKRDKTVAAFMVGIGMKESKFGIYSPKKDGHTCYNYWGYRGKENTTDSGYSCFNNPEQAVKIVGDRIEALVNYGRTTPEEMVVWKCGYTCDWDNPKNVDKWIKDVAIHYYGITLGNQLAKLTK